MFYVIMKVKSPGKSNSNLLLFVQRYGGKGIILPTDDKKKHCIKDFTCRRTWDKTEIIPEIEQKYFSKLSSVYEKSSTFINDHRCK